jgi:hypothetical protein
MSQPAICPRCRKNPRLVHGYCRICKNIDMQERRSAGSYQPSEAEKRANAARAYARYYLKKGLIQKGPCEVEGCVRPSRMHIDDFNKPLIVRWRCVVHRIRRGKRGDPPDRAV